MERIEQEAGKKGEKEKKTPGGEIMFKKTKG